MLTISVSLTFFCFPLISAFLLEGHTSFTKFKPWPQVKNANNTLTLEFSTNQPDGLLLYADDGGESDFFELKLVEGSLRLRYSLAEDDTQLLQVGRHLNDNLWHRVEVRVGQEVALTVDGFVTQSRIVGKGACFDNGGNVYIGGLPNSFNNRLGELTLPSVVFEPRFRGAVRNVVFGADYKAQEPVEWKGLISSPSDACERHDPCQHGGFCISTDAGPVCDCKMIDFEGRWCEREKQPTSATFHGSEFIGYDFRESGGEPIISTLDEISFSFKTKLDSVHDGLLFYSGDSVDYLALSLREGRISISVNLGSGPLDAKIHPDNFRFDDGAWHEVRVHRKVQEMSKTTSLCHITASVDGIHFDRWTLAGSFTMLSSNRVTIGGYDMVRPLPGIKGLTNFVGCLKKVEYRADTLRLSLLELGKSGNNLVSVGGRVQWGCEETAVDVTEENLSGSIGSGEMKLVTTTVTFTTSESFLTLPKWNGSRGGSLGFKLRTTERDGLVFHAVGKHSITIELQSGHLYVHYHTPTHLRIQSTTDPIDDGEWHSVKLTRTGRSGTITVDDITTDFNIKNPEIETSTIYLGNVPNQITEKNIWSINLKQGFVGCMRAVTLNDMQIDLVTIASQQDIGSVRSGCLGGSAGFCVANPCHNNGRCRDGWGRFICECAVAGGDDSYGGVVCQKSVKPVLTDGAVVGIGNYSFEGEANSIIFKFKSQRGNGIVLSFVGPRDLIEFSLEHTRLKVRVKLNDREKSLISGRDLVNSWVLVQFNRRGNLINLKIDDIPPVSGEILTRSWVMYFSSVYVGSVLNPFVGRVNYLEYNQLQLLSYMKTIVDVVSISDYVGLPQLRIYASGDFSFAFKSKSGGVIFYNGGVRDYIFMEVDEVGRVGLGFDCGRGGVELVSEGSYLDDRWHFVEGGWDYQGGAYFKVDGVGVEGAGCGEVLDLNGVFYLGGPPHTKKKKFPGCLATLEFAKEYINPSTDALVNSQSVVKGCTSEQPCTSSSCHNGGICITATQCNCDLTGFYGDRCEVEATTYKFSNGHLTYKPLYFDKLNIGFLLVTRGEGTIVSVGKHGKGLDLSVHGGRVKVKVSGGGETVGLENTKRVDDGGRHSVGVVLGEGNVKLVVDGEEVEKSIGGGGWGVGGVVVGGKRGESLLSGLVINGERIFELATSRDPRVKISGGVSRGNYLGMREEDMQKTTASLTPSNDDLISSGDSKCSLTTDDEDDCLVSSGNLDDLITPIYIPTTPRPTPSTTPTTTSVKCTDDDEDCLEVGSGFSPKKFKTTTITTTFKIPTNATTIATTSKSTTTISTTKLTTKLTPSTTLKTTTTTRFIPPHPPSLPPYNFPKGRDFDFETATTVLVASTTSEPIYLDTAAGDSTLVVIIIIAVLMIVIVSILILFFMCKRREDPIYKVAEVKYEYPPVSAPRKSGVKEWYV